MIAVSELGRLQTAASQLSAAPSQEELNQKLAALPPVVYKICPTTTIVTGLQTGFDPATTLPTFDPPGSLTIIIATPNVTLQCGDKGEVKDNCVLLHGATSIFTLAEFPPLGPFKFNTDNLVIEGFTLSGYMEGALSDGRRLESDTESMSCEMQDGRTKLNENGSALFRNAISVGASGRNIRVANILAEGLEGSVISLGGTRTAGPFSLVSSDNTIFASIKKTVIRDSLSYTGFFRSQRQSLKVTKTIVKNVEGCDVQEVLAQTEGVLFSCRGSGTKCTIRRTCISDSKFLSSLVMATAFFGDSKLPKAVSRGVRLQNVSIVPNEGTGIDFSPPSVCEDGLIGANVTCPCGTTEFECSALDIKDKACSFSLDFE